MPADLRLTGAHRPSRMTDSEFAEWFWSKVNKDGPTMAHMGSRCWEWTGHRGRAHRYGELSFRGTMWRAHRVAALLSGIPTNQYILHACDNRACVRPDHLRSGTPADNHNDMVARGRKVTGSVNVGEANGGARLTKAQAIEIYTCGGTLASVAARFGVSPQHVSEIRRGLKWRSVTANYALRNADGSLTLPELPAPPVKP